MAVFSHLIPIGDLSLEERVKIRRNAEDGLVVNAVDLRIRLDPEDLIVRDALPAIDLGLAATQDWLIAGPGVAGVELQYISAALANTRCLAIFGVSVEGPAPFGVSYIRLTQGPASTTVKGVYQLEQLYSRLEAAGYFSETVYFPNNQTVRIMVTPRIAFLANVQRLALLALLCEPTGDVVGKPSL